MAMCPNVRVLGDALNGIEQFHLTNSSLLLSLLLRSLLDYGSDLNVASCSGPVVSSKDSGPGSPRAGNFGLW